ncbi:hypothetical protein LXL04_038593 [Taraxacum kok-saghyz]
MMSHTPMQNRQLQGIEELLLRHTSIAPFTNTNTLTSLCFYELLLMAASNRHRRLMEHFTNIAAVGKPFCMLQCDPEENPSGVCFPFCVTTCPSFCHLTDRPFPPSSSPSPAFSPYAQPLSPGHKKPELSFHFKISVTFLIVSFVYTLYKFYIVWYRSRRRRTVPPLEHREILDDDVLDHPIWYIRTAGLQPSVINAITAVKFRNDGGVIVGGCSVCLSEFEADETLRLLPNCKHAFHISCIDTWLQSHTTCPLCRAGIVDCTADEPPPEENTDDVRFTGETDLRISVMEDDDREEATESSGLTNGETDEDDPNRNGEFFLTRRPVSMEDFAASDHRGIQFQYVDGGSEIELSLKGSS